MKSQKEKIITNNDVSLCTEHFGDQKNPGILLIAGATVSMLYWDTGFCKQLADKGYFVIRYDNRDVGKSTTYATGSISYDITDLADDAVHILDANIIKKATVIGISLGGLIAQIIAIKNTDRINSLILMSTGIWGTADVTIPEMDKEVINLQHKAENVNWDDEEAVVDYMLQYAHLMAGLKPVDYEREEKRVREEFNRAVNYRSMFNNSMVGGGESYYNRLHEINVSTFISHGTHDKIWHFEHSKSLLAKIKHSRLLRLDGTGHKLNYNDWNMITATISQFIKSTFKEIL